MDDRDAYIEMIVQKINECSDVSLLDLILKLLCRK